VSGPILLVPPVAFCIILLVVGAKFAAMRALGPRANPTPAKLKPYACGEDMAWGTMQPDYSQFFPVAVLFTVLHVSVLVVATVPHGPAALLALVYLVFMQFATVALLGELKTV
jgi:NADH:ubiquinone oxidoreductase subunit 3 (subunit A)